MNTDVPLSRRVWLALLTPPVLFLLAIVAASTWIGATRGGDAEAIAQQVTDSTPSIHLVVQAAMLLVLLLVLRGDRLTWRAIGWTIPSGSPRWREILAGLVPGVVLGLL